jgi:hypothetical protein
MFTRCWPDVADSGIRPKAGGGGAGVGGGNNGDGEAEDDKSEVRMAITDFRDRKEHNTEHYTNVLPYDCSIALFSNFHLNAETTRHSLI